MHRDTVETARNSRLVAQDGHWLWAGGVIYADPLTRPVTIQVRHLRRRADNVRLRVMVSVVPVFTGGASVSWAMRSWFQQHSVCAPAGSHVGYLLVPDPDEAGREWEKAIRTAIRRGKGVSFTVHPPDGLDPDEAILQGWWPEGI